MYLIRVLLSLVDSVFFSCDKTHSIFSLYELNLILHIQCVYHVHSHVKNFTNKLFLQSPKSSILNSTLQDFLFVMLSRFSKQINRRKNEMTKCFLARFLKDNVSLYINFFKMILCLDFW